MFGKKSSMNANERFVMAMGQKAGNLPKKAKPVTHTGKPDKPNKANPLKANGGTKVAKGKMNVVINDYKMSPGTVNTFKTQGKK